jgi:hypothetical protein
MYESVKYRSLLSRDRLNSLYNVGLACSKLDGDFVELGCHCGGTSFLLASLVKSPNMLHAFDSFVGFPKPTLEDVEKFHEDYLNCDYDITYSYLNSHNNFYSKNKVKIYKGFIEDTLMNIDNIKLSLVHCDVDSYSSTKFAIEKLWKNIVSGGCMVFDNYLHWRGERKTVDEFFGDLFKYNHWVISPQLGVIKT